MTDSFLERLRKAEEAAKAARREAFARRLHTAQTSDDELIDQLFELTEKHERLQERYNALRNQEQAALSKEDLAQLVNILAVGSKGGALFVDKRRRVMINMNDFYDWACADGEYILPTDFDLVLECRELGKKHGSEHWLDLVSMVKREGQLPQYPMWECYNEKDLAMCRERFGEDWDAEYVAMAAREAEKP